MSQHQFYMESIGTVRVDKNGYCLALEPRYKSALSGLEGYSHLQLLWWFSGCDNDRNCLTEARPYTRGPERLGTFATRSPRRPNPLALSCAQITYLDQERGLVGVAFLDADDGSPVLDLKPYTPSLDRVEHPRTPGWCAHWPKSVEESGAFDWAGEFSG